MKLEKPELEQKMKELNKQNELMKQQLLILEQELLKVFFFKYTGSSKYFRCMDCFLNIFYFFLII